MSAISLKDAVRIAADGDAILFVGAGIGFLVEGPNGPLPDGPKLSNRILSRPDDTPNPPPLDKAVGFVIRKGAGVESVFDTLRQNLTAQSVDPKLASLYRLPWRRIYTTNYDDAIQIARNKIQPTNSCTLENGTENARIGTVLHINGKLSNVSPASIEKELSLSDRSYADRNLERSSWYGYLSRDLESARSVIFIGYSLYDLDISRLVFSTDISEKTFFFVSPTVDEIEEETISLYGQTPGGGVFNLLETVTDALADYRPISKVSRYTYLKEIGKGDANLSKEPSRILDAQMVFGILPERQVIDAAPVFSDRQYIIQRDQAKKAIESINRGLFRDIVITGEFVSGKSATALSITGDFIRRGYKAYFATHGPHLSEELADLATKDDRIVVVFEGYSTLKRTILEYARRRHARHRLIITEQAVQHELHGDFLHEPALAGQFYEVILDRIVEPDARSFAELLDFGGYWRERSGASDEANAHYIVRKLDASLYRLLVEIVESTDVQRRIDGLLAPILTNRRATEVFVAACIVNVLGVNFRISDWVGAFDSQYAQSVLRNYSNELRYFLLVQSGNVFPRSGLLSSFILRRVPEKNIVLDAALKLFKVAAKERKPFDMYDDVFVRLMQFNRLQPIMSGDSEKELILSFYEQIRPLSGTHKNPDYWLQLGIAGTALDELDIAGDAFETAYAKEEKEARPKFKKIDNYYNRYLLAYAASLADSQDAYEMFVEATKGLTRQMFLEDNRHYPFKSGRMYGEIAKKHFRNWRPDQRENFISETRAIRDKAIEYEKDHKGQSIDVEVLIRETGELLAKISP